MDYNPAIKMIHLIILAAARKVYKQSATCDSLLARTTSYVYRRDVMTQCHAWISHENLHVPLKIRKHYYKLTVVNHAKGNSFEHWLVM